ncbi:hypothetical protein D3C72_2166540 [compost metagenome]
MIAISDPNSQAGQVRFTNKKDVISMAILEEKIHEDIKKMIDRGNKIEDLILITSSESMSEIAEMETRYGTLRVRYNYMLPKGSMFLITPNKLFF